MEERAVEKDLKRLVELAKTGDQQAIAQLYEQTSRRAYYLAKQLVKDEDQAQAIVQDAYVKVFTNLPLLEQVENFQGWLNTIVVNRSKDYLKKKKPMLFSQMVSEEDEGSELDFEDEGGYFSPDQKVDYAETKRLIQGMIDRLPQEQRMAIVLFYLEEMPVKQIARVMECSEGTVKSRLNYGRKAIKAQVLELEKKGTKLYCVPFIPFLYWLFRQQVLSTVVPGAVRKAAVAAAVAAACIGAGGVGAGAGVYLHSRQAALETDADETAAEESENREEREEIEETSFAAQENGPVQVEQNTQLIMEHLLSPLIYWNGQESNFSVETADLSNSQRLELAYWNMNNNEDWELLDAGLQIFDTEGNSSDAAGIYSLSQVADRLADMYGGDISEEQLLSEAENGMLLKLTPEVEEGQITYEPMDGEGWTTVNFEEFTMNGGKLEADGTYTIDFNSGDRLEGKIEAVFIPNPDSFFGYTLESVTGAEREESQEVQASVASPRIYSTNELGSEYPETSAAETAPETSASAEASNYTMARCDICSDETMCRSVWVEAFGESLMICDSCMVELQWIGQQVQAEMNE